MLFDPQTKKLYTDDGVFIKKLYCPLKMHVTQLKATGEKLFCQQCQHTIVETKNLTEQELQNIVAQDPEVCIAVSAAQTNIEILPPHSGRVND